MFLPNLRWCPCNALEGRFSEEGLRISWDLGMRVNGVVDFVFSSMGHQTALTCVPLERSTQRTVAAFLVLLPRWVVAFLELSSAWVGTWEVCPGPRGSRSTAQWSGSRLAISQQKRTEKLEVFSKSLHLGLICLCCTSFGEPAAMWLRKIERKHWEAERLTGEKSKQTSMNNTGCRSALELVYKSSLNISKALSTKKSVIKTQQYL